jgi:RNA polymerase sigma-70 factor (ECF subfamily)
VRAFAPRLRSAVIRLTGEHLRNEADPDDVLQEVFSRAFQSLAGFEWKGEESFYRWLRGIAENRILRAADRKRRARVLQLRSDVAASSTAAVSPSRALRREERFDRLQKALESLSPAHREVVLLARIEGLEVKEIARRLGKSVSAVQSLLFRALKELKRSFGDTRSLHLPARSLEEGGARHEG